MPKLNTDVLTTVLGVLTALFAAGIPVALAYGSHDSAVALGALAAASHAASSFLINKPSA